MIGKVCCLSIILAILLSSFVFMSAVPYPNRLENCSDNTFLLTTKRSGTNRLTCCLTAITHRPISWIHWGNTVLSNENSVWSDLSYNRLGLPLESLLPIVYRTHNEFNLLAKIPSKKNRLIFLTRNPKELLVRQFNLDQPDKNEPDKEYIDSFLSEYLQAFNAFLQWHPDNRRLVFYEDLIVNDEEILIDLLHFMNVETKYWDDFKAHKGEYLAQSLESYQEQHARNKGGLSASSGPKALYYTKGVSLDLLHYIDDYLQRNASSIWNVYLYRFQEKDVRTKLYCFYTPEFETLYQDYFLPSICDDFEVVTKVYPQECPKGEYMSEGWGTTMLRKLEMLEEAVLEHMENKFFIYSDVDIIFLKPILDTVSQQLGNYDIVAQQGWPYDMMCAGFIVMRGNKRTLKLVRLAKELLSEGKYDSDQTALNHLLQLKAVKGISWKLLPTSQFPNGRRMIKKKDSLYEPGKEIFLDDQMLLFHANCCIGLNVKYYFLNEVKKLTLENMQCP